MTVVWLSCLIWQELDLISILFSSSFTKWQSNRFLNNVLTRLHLLWASLQQPQHFHKPEIGFSVGCCPLMGMKALDDPPVFYSFTWHSDEMFPDVFGFIPHIISPSKHLKGRRPLHKTWPVIGRTFWRSQSKQTSQIIYRRFKQLVIASVFDLYQGTASRQRCTAEFRDGHASKSRFLLDTKDKLIGSEILWLSRWMYEVSEGPAALQDQKMDPHLEVEVFSLFLLFGCWLVFLPNF